MSILELHFASGEESLSVRRFTVEEALSAPFGVSILARSPSDAIDLETIVGRAASFRIASGLLHVAAATRLWTGLCRSMEQVRVEPSGLSTYEIRIVPALWLLTQRRNNRIFQHISIPDIVETLLAEWSIERRWAIDRERYPRLEYRVQYGESDHAFLSRLLEEAGLTYFFEQDLEKGSRLVLVDEPQAAEPHGAGAITFVDSPGQAQAAEKEYITGVRLGQDVRPGRFTVRDFDFRRPAYKLFGAADAENAIESPLEQYHYLPGAALSEAPDALASTEKSLAALGRLAMGTKAVADDKGTARFEKATADRRAELGLAGGRSDRREVRYGTNVINLAPGTVFAIAEHPRPDLADDCHLLATRFTLEGTQGEEWTMRGTAVFAAAPYRPSRITPKPVMAGLQSAIVTGPPGEEIYTDELGRIRVQMHWDRLGKHDDNSSIWMRVGQGFAGPGYGLFTVPRVGHEVLVSFLDGDPDCPVVVTRVFNGAAPVPHKLPENKTVSTWKSSSSPGGGGFNEIRLDDAAGREHVYVQAERDLDQLVKNDLSEAVGHDRTRHVRHNETITIGRNQTKIVHFDETEVAGLNKTTTVGVSRSSVVGVDDTTLVGSKFSVTMARGLTKKLTQELGERMKGPLASVLYAPIASLLGMVPQTALGLLGEVIGTVARGPLSALSAVAPEAARSVLGLLDGFTDEAGPPPTTIEMVDRKITFSTGEASITLDGPNITFHAEGNIMLHAQGNAAVLADGEAALASERRLTLHARSGDLVIQGDPTISLNPFDLQADRRAPDGTVTEHVHAKPEELPALCTKCGKPTVSAMQDGREHSRVCSVLSGGVTISPEWNREQIHAFNDELILAQDRDDEQPT